MSSERTYYKVSLDQAAATRETRAKSQGINGSPLTHENPVWLLSPDGAYAIHRAHWDTQMRSSIPRSLRTQETIDALAAAQAVVMNAKVDYEALSSVEIVSRAEAAALVSSWSPGEDAPKETP